MSLGKGIGIPFNSTKGIVDIKKLQFSIINGDLTQNIFVDDEFDIIEKNLVVDGPNENDYNIVGNDLIKN